MSIKVNSYYYVSSFIVVFISILFTYLVGGKIQESLAAFCPVDRSDCDNNYKNNTSLNNITGENNNIKFNHYINSKLGYSIMYPENLKFKEDSDGGVVFYGKNWRNVQITVYDLGDEMDKFRINWDYGVTLGPRTTLQQLISDIAGKKLFESSPIVISGNYSAHKLAWGFTNSTHDIPGYEEIFTIRDNKVYRIDYNVYQEDRFNSTHPIQKQMIESFKFHPVDNS